ncbi:MAG: M67 family metallopeptidase [Thiogranum sp.]|nr:M67 family metallopeptidase [Thiogranum sp.]
MQSIRLPRELCEQILAHARSAPDVEVCGLVAASNGIPLRCVPVSNIARQPQRYFTMDPKQQIDAFRVMRERGEQLFAIYHSHPRGPAHPSDTDLQEAGYPDVVHIIVSADSSDPAPLRCYRFIAGKIVELELTS